MQYINLMKTLAQIQDMCIGAITMGQSMDAEHIGEIISDATEMSAQEFKGYLESLEKYCDEPNSLNE